MNFADYHTHTPLCRHATGTVAEFAAQAQAAGIIEWGISDHCPWSQTLDDWRMDRTQWPEYLDWISLAKQQQTDHFAVKVGLEVDWLVGCENWLDELSTWAEFDYWIGAVHYLEPGWDFDHPEKVARLDQMAVEEAWQRYFSLYREMVLSGRFQIAAHPDLIKKFGHRPLGDLQVYFQPVVEALLETDTAIEINTAGWDKPCKEAYPGLEFLRLCAQAKVGLVLSSDAHAPAEVGRYFPRAVELAKLAGFTTTRRFTEQKWTEVLL